MNLNIVASSNIKTTISRIRRPLLRTPPKPDSKDEVKDIAAPGSNLSIIAEPEICNPNCSKNSRKLVAEAFTISLYLGRFSLKSLKEVPKREAMPVPTATIPKITTKIAPKIGMPFDLSFATSGFAITDIKIASNKGINISLAALNPATTIIKAAKLKITC